MRDFLVAIIVVMLLISFKGCGSGLVFTIDDVPHTFVWGSVK
jgi:hypothetical protein